jgi:hypothetical protein
VKKRNEIPEMENKVEEKGKAMNWRGDVSLWKNEKEQE